MRRILRVVLGRLVSGTRITGSLETSESSIVIVSEVSVVTSAASVGSEVSVDSEVFVDSEDSGVVIVLTDEVAFF